MQRKFYDGLAVAVRNVYDDTITAMREKFTPAAMRDLYWNAFRTRYQRPAETVSEFYTALMEYAVRMYPAGANMEPALIRGQFISGLRDPIRSNMMSLAADATVDQMLERAQLVERNLLFSSTNNPENFSQSKQNSVRINNVFARSAAVLDEQTDRPEPFYDFDEDFCEPDEIDQGAPDRFELEEDIQAMKLEQERTSWQRPKPLPSQKEYGDQQLAETMDRLEKLVVRQNQTVQAEQDLPGKNNMRTKWSATGKIQCHFCKGYGHIIKDCPVRNSKAVNLQKGIALLADAGMNVDAGIEIDSVGVVCDQATPANANDNGSYDYDFVSGLDMLASVNSHSTSAATSSIVQFFINGIMVSGLFDTGAGVSVLAYRVSTKLPGAVLESLGNAKPKILSVTGSAIRIIGRTYVTVYFGKAKLSGYVLVCDSMVFEFVFGRDMLRYFGPISLDAMAGEVGILRTDEKFKCAKVTLRSGSARTTNSITIPAYSASIIDMNINGCLLSSEFLFEPNVDCFDRYVCAFPVMVGAVINDVGSSDARDYPAKLLAVNPTASPIILPDRCDVGAITPIEVLEQKEQALTTELSNLVSYD